MAIKTAQFKIQGMNQDNSESVFPEKFAFEIQNMRIDAGSDNTLLSLTNEKGNLLAVEEDSQLIHGTPLGYAVINDQLVLFTHDSSSATDYIYKIVFTNDQFYKATILFEGILGFSLNYTQNRPIETLAWYESDTIQKVYWIDGIHQPRMINIANYTQPSGIVGEYTGFDFSQKLALRENVMINQGNNGQFHSGVVQYFITYYNKNGTESNIAWQSPLMYVSFDDRGGSPEDVVPKSFTLFVTDIDQNFDYMRLYCVHRTTLDGEVYVRRVQDFSKGTNLSYNTDGFTDNGILGELVDSSYLMYVGGDELIAGCFTQKDQILFLGDAETIDLSVFPANNPTGVAVYTDSDRYKKVPDSSIGDYLGKYYNHYQQDNSQGYDDTSIQCSGNSNISTFKYLETYRFGVQFQFDTGKWSNVVYVGDAQIDCHVEEHIVEEHIGYHTFSKPEITLSQTFLNSLPYKDRIKKVRPVCVFPNTYERDVICQGILCPTVYNTNDRVTGNTFSYSSWFSRPNAPASVALTYSGGSIVWPEDLDYTPSNYPTNPYAVRTEGFKDKGCWAEFRHNHGMPPPQQFNGEIQMQFREDGGMPNALIDVSEYSSPAALNDKFANGFNIDQSIFTMHSPDIEFNDNIQNVSLKNAKLRIIGYVPVNANSGDIRITASNPEKYKAYECQITYSGSASTPDTIDFHNEIPGRTSPNGFYSEKVGVKVNSDYGWFNLINGPYWQDKLYNPGWHPGATDGYSGHENHFVNTEYIKYGFVIYPWHQHGSLSNDNDENKQYSILQTKILTNLKYSLSTKYFEKDTTNYGDVGYWTSANEEYDSQDTGLSDAIYVDSLNHFTMFKSPFEGISVGYDGNMDKLLPFNKNDWSPRLTVYPTAQRTLPDWNYVVPDYETTSDYPVNIYDDGSYTTQHTPSYTDDLYFDGYNTPTSTKYNIQEYYTMYNTGVIAWLPNGTPWSNNHPYYYRSPLPKYHIGSGAYVEYSVSSEEPISMRYKCSPHIVMALNEQSHYEYTSGGVQYSLNHLQRCLPTAYKSNKSYPINRISHVQNQTAIISGYNIVDNFNDNTHTRKLYYDPMFDDSSKVTKGCMQSIVRQADFTNENHGFYWLAELYRDAGEITNKFGGTSEEALANNVWHVCGEAVYIGNSATITLECTEGDTFYQRYDHLKTMPYSENDENQVIEIISFMCESRYNLDGRYDKLRGVDDGRLISPEAFNSINKVYSQLDNYLSQSYIKENTVNTHFPNSVIWSDKKINGEDVDKWTQLHAENILDLDGKNGRINALKTFRNEIYAFQDTAIANILYNSRTALSTEQGGPVQLASTGLVEGKQYLTNTIGCLNKWSICETPIGLVFTDDYNKSIMAMSDGFENLSEKFGMSTWVRNNVTGKPWDLDFSNMVTYYDRNNKDILFVTDEQALAYSIRLGAFTSFYSYGGVPFIVNYNDKVLDIVGAKNNINRSLYTQIYGQNLGDYNKFFGAYEPFYVTLAVSGNPVTDKIFNTVEYRADFYDNSGIYDANNTFSSIRAMNEYQDTMEQALSNVSAMYPNNVKKKFRIWRVEIPRNYGTMDRIRNPWTYIKLKKDTTGYTGKMQLHDIQVHYTE